MASATATYGQKESSDQNFDYMFKILIIGNSSVGKTSFLFRYADDSFTPAFVSTVGIDFKVKTIYRNDKRIKLQIWVRNLEMCQVSWKEVNLTKIYKRARACVFSSHTFVSQTFPQVNHHLQLIISVPCSCLFPHDLWATVPTLFFVLPPCPKCIYLFFPPHISMNHFDGIFSGVLGSILHY